MTEHERRIHDSTIKAYEAYETDEIAYAGGVPRLGNNYLNIQQKYINKAFGTGNTPTQSPEQDKSSRMKRPNLNQVVAVSPLQHLAAPNGTLNQNNS